MTVEDEAEEEDEDGTVHMAPDDSDASVSSPGITLRQSLVPSIPSLTLTVPNPIPVSSLVMSLELYKS